MIPPWSEAEKAIIEALIYKWEGDTVVAWRLPEAEANLAALRACLARAEQADTGHCQCAWVDGPDGREPEPVTECLYHASVRQRAEQAEADLAAFKARSAESVEAMSTRIAELDAARQQAEAERDEARQAVVMMRETWDQILAVKNDWEMELLAVCSVIDEYPLRYEGVAERVRTLREQWQAKWQQAEAQIIPVADRERALELARESGWQVSQGDRTVSVEQHAEARRLLKLASPGTRTEEP